MTFIVLTIIFGGIMLIDDVKQNSPITKQKQLEAKQKAKQEVDEIRRRIDREAKEYIERWEKTGLPVYMWK